ncbi:MAG: hypothetical protein ACTSYC_09565 [Promethearchaeota archaeon]
MIESIYILNENGELLYENLLTESIFDSNLLIGFFSSITNFSREALNSVINYLDLGENKKLIIISMSREGLLGAMIANSKDDNSLLNKILRTVLLDFIDEYSPEYDVNKIDPVLMDKIVANNLKGKKQPSMKKRVIFSWLIVGPFSYFLLFISILTTQFLYSLFQIDQLLLLYSQTEIFTMFMPAIVVLAIANILIIFTLPNFILGFLIGHLRISFISSFFLVIFILTLYFFSTTPLFAYIIIANLPFAFFVSFSISYVGTRLSKRKFLISE